MASTPRRHAHRVARVNGQDECAFRTRPEQQRRRRPFRRGQAHRPRIVPPTLHVERDFQSEQIRHRPPSVLCVVAGCADPNQPRTTSLTILSLDPVFASEQLPTLDAESPKELFILPPCRRKLHDCTPVRGSDRLARRNRHMKHAIYPPGPRRVESLPPGPGHCSHPHPDCRVPHLLIDDSVREYRRQRRGDRRPRVPRHVTPPDCLSRQATQDLVQAAPKRPRVSRVVRNEVHHRRDRRARRSLYVRLPRQQSRKLRLTAQCALDRFTQSVGPALVHRLARINIHELSLCKAHNRERPCIWLFPIQAVVQVVLEITDQVIVLRHTTRINGPPVGLMCSSRILTIVA